MSKAAFESVEELSLSELSAVLGGQNARQQAANEFSDQLKETLKSYAEALSPLFAPVRETVKLAYAGDHYFKTAYEHQYPTVSDAHANKVEQDKADKAKHEQEERDHALQGSKPTNAGDVAVWLDATNPDPGPPPDISVPTWMTEAPHEAQISIEPLPSGNENYTY